MTSKQSPKLIERFYASFGPFYNFVYGKLLFNEGRRVAIDFLDLHSGNRVLEVGVGTGLTLPMYPSHVEVIGIDLSESMMAEAKVLISKYRLKNVQLIKMNANKLAFPDSHFDAVLGNLFISATNDPVGALNEMRRVCKPGGKLVLMNHFKSENPLIGKMEDLINPIAKSLGFTSALELDSLLKATKLHVDKREKVNFLGYWTAVSMINNK